MQQRTTEWLDKTQVNTDYHQRQLREPYRSTIAFCDWLETLGLISPDRSLRILDLAAGLGTNMFYMSQRYPQSTFVGVDLNAELVEKGNALFEERGVSNCHLEVGNIYEMDSSYAGKFDGVVCYQSLLCLPDFERPVQTMIDVAPQWIAATSLFYDGQVSCRIEATEYTDDLEPHRSSFYNIYSLPVVSKYFRDHGYPGFEFTRFEIDRDLPKPERKIMSTYTEKLGDGHRLQISGPLLMPWYFIAGTR